MRIQVGQNKSELQGVIDAEQIERIEAAKVAGEAKDRKVIESQFNIKLHHKYN